MLRLACFSLSIAFLAGCGGGGADSEMNGTVMYEGKTLTYGKVIVIDQNGDSRFGVIKPDGKYQVTGLHPGPVKIVVYNLIPSVAAPGTSRRAATCHCRRGGLPFPKSTLIRI